MVTGIKLYLVGRQQWNISQGLNKNAYLPKICIHYQLIVWCIHYLAKNSLSRGFWATITLVHRWSKNSDRIFLTCNFLKVQKCSNRNWHTSRLTFPEPNNRDKTWNTFDLFHIIHIDRYLHQFCNLFGILCLYNIPSANIIHGE